MAGGTTLEMTGGTTFGMTGGTTFRITGGTACDDVDGGAVTWETAALG